ncbi:MAG: hypothetical protein HYY16_01040 [Planctomycetes bacterium]|nr:hypothetical protein [Planctomycetota bacterium]
MNRRYWLPVLACGSALAFLAVRQATLGPDPREAERLYHEAQEIERQARPEDALARYRASLAYDPENIVVHREYQRLMRKVGRLEDVRVEYRRRAVNLPQSPAAQYLAARLEEDDALEQGMKNAVRLDPDFIWAHRALGRHYLTIGREEEALDELRRVLALTGSDTEDAGTLLALLYRRRRFEEIDRLIENWIARRPAFCDPQEVLLSFGLGRRPDGTDLQLHVALDPQVPFLYGLRLVRADRAYRQISVRAAEGAYVVRSTREWVSPGQADAPADQWEREKRPGFAEIHVAFDR